MLIRDYIAPGRCTVCWCQTKCMGPAEIISEGGFGWLVACLLQNDGMFEYGSKVHDACHCLNIISLSLSPLIDCEHCESYELKSLPKTKGNEAKVWAKRTISFRSRFVIFAPKANCRWVGIVLACHNIYAYRFGVCVSGGSSLASCLKFCDL